MKVLALASYPVEAAATRYRLYQFVDPLRERGITLTIHPFLDSRLFAGLYKRNQWPRTALGLVRSAVNRLGDVFSASGADVLLVQREAMMMGPPVIEWLLTKAARRPMVLDLDDATYVHYTSPSYGRLGSALKWIRKTDDLIRWAQVVTCGSRAIADYVVSKGASAVVIPTVVDTEKFRPRADAAPQASATETASSDDAVVLGWIGTHSTYPFLESIFPALQSLAREYRIRLKVVGAGREVSLPGVEVESLEWRLEREIEDFQSFDIGLYPLVANDWSVGKSGFKAIQYMAVGIPFVVSPVGACGEIGEPGVTHYCATTTEEWRAALGGLLADAALRRAIGEAGRAHALQHYTVPMQADKLAQALRQALHQAQSA